jgi:hypothetical protein
MNFMRLFPFDATFPAHLWAVLLHFLMVYKVSFILCFLGKKVC